MFFPFSSVQFSSVMSNSLRPHESQHARPPSPSPTPGVHSDSRSLSQCCHPAISSSVIPFSSCPQYPPSIRVFSNESTLCVRCPKYQSFSALASFLPKKSQGRSPCAVFDTFSKRQPLIINFSRYHSTCLVYSISCLLFFFPQKSASSSEGKMSYCCIPLQLFC